MAYYNVIIREYDVRMGLNVYMVLEKWLVLQLCNMLLCCEERDIVREHECNIILHCRKHDIAWFRLQYDIRNGNALNSGVCMIKYDMPWRTLRNMIWWECTMVLCDESA
jgi:hypothetical protein